MKIQIKLLGRESFAVQATPETHIFIIKQQIHELLAIPIEDQRLLLEGQILKDDKKVKHFDKLQDNSKLNLIIVTKKTHPLYNKMYEFIRPRCSEKETQKILSIFMRKVYDSFRLLSLDDLERVAHEALQDNGVKSGTGSEVKQELL